MARHIPARAWQVYIRAASLSSLLTRVSPGPKGRRVRLQHPTHPHLPQHTPPLLGRGLLLFHHSVCHQKDPASRASCPSVPTPQEYGGDQLRQLVQALCPSIYGHELVKAGLVLALLGGVRKHAAGAGGQRARVY